MSTFAKTIDVTAAAKDMDLDVLECRDFGHTWRTRHIERHRDRFERVLVCQRCATEAVQILSRTGVVLGRRYTYADGYLFKGIGRLDANAKGAIRLAIFDTQADIVSDVKDKPRKRRPSPNGRQSQ